MFTEPDIHRRDFIRRAMLTAAAMSLPRFLRAQSTAPSILTRKIPRSGEPIPVVGMGTWQTFDPPAIDDDSLSQLQQVMRLFFDAGGRVIDSSPMYGKAEEVTGILSDRLGINRELFLATKVWTTGRDEGIRQMENSLRLLKRDRLELMQIHNLTDWRTQLQTIRAWKSQGRIKYIGITHYQLSRFDELEKIVRSEQVDFIQLPYSIAVREAEKRLLPAARDTGTAVLVMRPFEGGNLFGKTKDQPLPDFVKPWAESWAQAFLKFILANEAVTCVIPATSKPKHMQDNISAGVGRLPDEQERGRMIERMGL